MITHFSDERMHGQVNKVSITVTNVASLAFTSCIYGNPFFFNLHYSDLCLTNVNLNATLTQLYGFCMVTFVRKACHIIPRRGRRDIDLSSSVCASIHSVCLSIHRSVHTFVCL